MKMGAAVAQTAWLASSLPAWMGLKRALREPAAAQQRLLRAWLSRDANCAFGRKCDFRSIKSYGEFAARVPLVTYEEVVPWVKRIQRGEFAALTQEPVQRLLPTSGSSGARKLIPFTTTLEQAFNAAVGPWMVDLWQCQPGIALGPSYWSITPAGRAADEEESAVPVGFEDDARYLGGFRQRLVEAALAAPSALARIEEMDTFFYVTLLCLLREADLRLISVWHPSFLTLLLRALPTNWDSLLFDLRHGRCREEKRLSPLVLSSLALRPLSRRAAELARADPRRPETLWPRLRVISCWGSAAAEGAAAELRRAFPTTVIQPKGLLATEAVVTLPFRGQYPVAVTSHFFEFIDAGGNVHPLENLEKGRVYEVAVTTGSGLWRYRLQDQVEVVDFVERTPSLRFLGRGDAVSDLYGEKLSEAFVARVLKEFSGRLPSLPAFMMLAPERGTEGDHYTLYIEGNIIPELMGELESALRRNPHYAYCRDLGQVKALRLFQIQANAHAAYLAAEQYRGLRVGDIKPRALSRATDWSSWFELFVGGRTATR